jgi:hypothetical protein
VAGVVALCLLASVLAGCGSGEVTVPSFPVTAAGHSVCPGLMKDLPDKVADQSRRRTTGSVFAAAYGDPAIVVRCGVHQPKDYSPTSTCLTARGLGWTVPPGQIEDSNSAVVLTLAKRSIRVEVKVPAHYRPYGPSEAMVDLTKTIKAHTTATGRCQ